MEKNMIEVGDWKTFITLRDEKLLLAIRSHPVSFILPIIILLFLLSICSITSFVVCVTFFSSITHFFIIQMILLSGAIGIVTKIIIDWYYHVYILTNRKILEFRYTPLMSYIVNDVMLDRVLCTEIDWQTKGWMNDILDIGDIILTFDRPTHQEEFILKDIFSSNKVGTYLTRELIDERSYTQPITPIWFNGRHWGRK